MQGLHDLPYTVPIVERIPASGLGSNLCLWSLYSADSHFLIVTVTLAQYLRTIGQYTKYDIHMDFCI